MHKLIVVVLLAALFCGCRGAAEQAMIISGAGLSLEARKRNTDIRFCLISAGGSDSLEFSLSGLCPVSTRKPWALSPQRFDSVGLELSGEALKAQGWAGNLETSLTFSIEDSLLRIDSRWRNAGEGTLSNLAVALALTLDHPLESERVTLPHILYNGNPSSDPSRLVPRFGREKDERLVCEETRFPVPAVNVEWLERGHPRCVTLFSLPDSAADWSLGVDREAGTLRALLASGVLALNSQKDRTYGLQRRTIPLEAGYRNLEPGGELSRTALIEPSRPESVGHGFRRLARTGWRVYRPTTAPVLPLDSVVALKANALDNRWRSGSGYAGFLAVLPGNWFNRPPYFLYGWSGQGLRLAWCSAKLGIETRNPRLVERCNRAVDFYVERSGTTVPGLSRNYYYLNEARWQGNEDGEEELISSRANGEALTNLGRVVRLYRDSGLPVPPRWVRFMRERAGFLLDERSRTPDGIFPVFWREDGAPESDLSTAAGVPCVLGLIETFRVTGDSACLTAAGELLGRYWRLSGDRFDRPFARSTLDAACEDKEAGLYFFLAARELFIETGDRRYRDWAEVSADWILTFVYFWHTGFKPDSYLARRDFVTTGWPGVSVQNHHLDVYFPAWELYDFGRRTGDSRLESLGRTVFDAWSHGICRYPGDWNFEVPGEQGEQFFQTNYGLSIDYWRGGYHYWNPSWIVALVLDAGLRFRYGD